MSLHSFDTLRFAERLEKAGLTRGQAAEFSKALGDFMQEKLVNKEDLQNLVTKDDFLNLKAELREDLQKLATKEELKENIKTLEEKLTYKLTIRLGSMLAASIAILGFLMKFGH